MPALHELQAQFHAALVGGLAFIPEGLFAGRHSRVHAALAIHANTISHARLIALEETFPIALALLGPADFNQMSRVFLEARGGERETLANIGRTFPDWLTQSGAAPRVFSSARKEWARLQSYHAAEARALSPTDLADLGEDGLLRSLLCRHPAAWLITGEPSQLITRPEAEVVETQVDQRVALVFGLVAVATPAAQCLEAALKFMSPEEAEAAFSALVQAGALALRGKV